MATQTGVARLVSMWQAADLDIVCVQETWAGRPNRSGALCTSALIASWLHLAAATAPDAVPYQTFWADNTAVAGENNGVLICVRPSANLAVSSPSASATGRLQTLGVRWAGHDFTLVNTYWPSSGPADRAAFLDGPLGPALHLHMPCVLGDFNFTSDPAVDRRGHAASTAEADLLTSARLSACLPAHGDAFRHRHPTVPSFTFHRGTHLARLDRVLLPAAMLPFVAAARTVHCGFGDHHAVAVDLRPAVPLQPRGPGRRPVPSSLTHDLQAADSLAVWALHAVEYGLTLTDEDLLAWWPGLQRAYTAYARSLAARQRWHRAAARAAAAAAGSAMDGAIQALAAAPTPAAAVAALPAVLEAQGRLRDATAHTARAAGAAWASFVATGERPSPHVSSLLAAPSPPPVIAALVAADGSSLTSHGAIAARLAQHYAAISGLPATDPESQDIVLAALQADLDAGRVLPIPPALADAAGSPGVTATEVLAALATCPPCSSPGPDGLPYALWRVGGGCWAPLLAKLFSAMGAMHVAPPGFNAGTITPLPKPGAADLTAPSSYRPITLLPALYRILSKVLAQRFGAAMAPSIGREQSAYLPGRRIEDANNFAALLPDVLAASGATAAIVYLDIAKAFDSVSREFIFGAMGVMGASAGMLAWARLLLADTRASVHANGVESAPLLWQAGVRQGCPLSPLLYLFVGQALVSWLRAQPELGVEVAGGRHVCSMYADDTSALIRLAQAAADCLRATMETFRKASGQAVNIPKSVAVAVGQPLPDPLPADLAGIPVATDRLHLGVPCSNPPPRPPLPARRHATRAALRPVPHPVAPPSAVAMAAATRRVEAARTALASVARLPLSAIGLGMAVSTYALSTILYHAEFAGLPPAAPTLAAQAGRTVARDIPLPLLTGSPALGGFGLLPLVQHTQARHAAMGSRLAAALMRHPAGHYTPGAAQPPGPDADAPWVHFAGFLLRRACPAIHPAQALLASGFATADDIAGGVLGLPGVRQQVAFPPGPLTRMAVALQAVGPPVLRPPPAGGPPPAVRGLLTAPTDAHVPPALSGLAWPRPVPAPLRRAAGAAGQRLLPVVSPPPPVRALTGILMAPAAARRAEAHAAFCRLAAGLHPRSGVQTVLSGFRARLRAAWRLPCPGALKVPFWRLAIDVTPGSRCRDWHCPCGGAPHGGLPRLHTFWECPVAQAVRAHLQLGLGVAPSHASVWLLGPPPAAGVHAATWTLVCLSAVAAMNHGRAFLWRLHQDAGGSRAPLPRAQVDQVCASAVAHFWRSLHDFAADSGVVADVWQLQPGHPFLDRVAGAERLRVSLPPGCPALEA